MRLILFFLLGILNLCMPCMYTVLHMFRQVLFWAGNQGNHQNFEKSLLSYKLWHVFMRIKQKKIQNGRLKKTEFFKTTNSQKNFAKISGIGPLLHPHKNQSKFLWKHGRVEIFMITLVSSPKQHLHKHMQHSVSTWFVILFEGMYIVLNNLETCWYLAV